MKSRIVHLVAHRGNAREFPENTLPALRSALALGVRFLEIDVQMSADGVPIVVHDAELERTTGIVANVLNLTAAELAKIEAAERGRFGETFAGTNLPTLADVVALLEGHPEVTLFVEVKRASLVRFGHDQVVPQILEVLRPWRGQVVLISFDLPAIHRARQMSGYTIGWVISDYDSHTRLKCEALQPDYVFCNHTRLPPRDNLWRGNWRWVIYEVTTIDLALSLASRGADFIETMAVSDMSHAMRAHAIGAA